MSPGAEGRGRAGKARTRETVISRFLGAGLRPRKALGQHFLHDPKILGEIAEAALLTSSDAVLEIGTGPGTLTRELAARAGRVLTVELDPRMLEFAEEEMSGVSGVRFLCADALGGKGELNPLLEAEVRALGPFKLVANLPYSIATQVLLALFSSGLPLSLGLVTIQRELAARILAAPPSRKYGPLSALLAFWATVERVRPLPPGAFWPPPEVSSEVIRIRPRPAPLGKREAYPAYRSWVHRLFSQRRKQVGGLLRDILGEEGASAALRTLGLKPTARPESIDPEGFVRMAEVAPAFRFDTVVYPP